MSVGVSIIGIIISVLFLAFLVWFFLFVKKRKGTGWAIGAVVLLLALCVGSVSLGNYLSTYTIEDVPLQSASETYSSGEIENAFQAVRDEEFWDHIRVLEARYAGDEESVEVLAYIQGLAPDKDYTECMLFSTDLRSPGSNHAGSLEPNTTYHDFQWYVACSEDGSWEVVTDGYA